MPANTVNKNDAVFSVVSVDERKTARYEYALNCRISRPVWLIQEGQTDRLDVAYCHLHRFDVRINITTSRTHKSSNNAGLRYGPQELGTKDHLEGCLPPHLFDHDIYDMQDGAQLRKKPVVPTVELTVNNIPMSRLAQTGHSLRSHIVGIIIISFPNGANRDRGDREPGAGQLW